MGEHTLFGEVLGCIYVFSDLGTPERGEKIGASTHASPSSRLSAARTWNPWLSVEWERVIHVAEAPWTVPSDLDVFAVEGRIHDALAPWSYGFTGAEEWFGPEVRVMAAAGGGWEPFLRQLATPAVGTGGLALGMLVGGTVVAR